mmetsp:Transcript_90851/g.278122  ORF Transcript_90851/g.278122 Transcript_90851/m.278122 type:complete len:210 (-) Transcript_90851:445-1074(-)
MRAARNSGLAKKNARCALAGASRRSGEVCCDGSRCPGPAVAKKICAASRPPQQEPPKDFTRIGAAESLQRLRCGGRAVIRRASARGESAGEAPTGGSSRPPRSERRHRPSQIKTTPSQTCPHPPPRPRSNRPRRRRHPPPTRRRPRPRPPPHGRRPRPRLRASRARRQRRPPSTPRRRPRRPPPTRRRRPRRPPSTRQRSRSHRCPWPR